MRAFLALGSNLGDRVGHLRAARDSIPDLVAESRVYETEPVGGPDQQGPYLNMVVELDTTLTPRDLLEVCRTVEAAGGRERTVHWGPRTIDVDIIWIDGVRVDEPDLRIPHPFMNERPFVLAPLEELAPDIVTPHWRHRLGEGGVACLGVLDDVTA
ncbi:MAG TPA: 2-amino-4-hydroxy-6-hydroxymethyldihydropteridine diphosphokinase [Acidimicrobiales bacterium]|nr:2-amino-4-hydroxy-6-hydroxymethyldihydropteridine diphosphokinase [Acidimicrobiales bacterium]